MTANKTRVALINPPVPNGKSWVREGRCQQLDIWGAPFPPLSLALVSRQLTDAGMETSILDAGPQKLDLDAVIERCVKLQPQWVVLAVATPTIETDLGWFLPALKKALPGIKSIAIGVHPSALPQETLETFPLLDSVVIGEPELAVKELILAHRDAASPDVAGVSFRLGNGEIKPATRRAPLMNLDSLGLPEWEKVDFSAYLLPILGRPFSLIHFSRGCPFRCNYCVAKVYNGGDYRGRSVAALVGEIEFNLSLGVSDFLFWTETLTIDTRRLHEFLDALLAKGLEKRIRWVCNSRVDTVDAALLKKMKAAGCWQIAFGFEFGSDAMLKKANKGGQATVEMARRAAKLASEAGLVVDGHFLMGYPGETESDLRRTADFARNLPLTFAHFYSVMPYPGTDLYDSWNATRNQDEIAPWSQFTQSRPFLETSLLSADTIERHRGRAYRRFYARPKTLVRVLRIPSRFSELVNIVRALYGLAELSWWEFASRSL